MSLRVNTNVEAFNAHRNLEGTQMKLSKSMQKLSSGLRTNSAAVKEDTPSASWRTCSAGASRRPTSHL